MTSMTQLLPLSTPPYARKMAKKAAKRGNGPWAEAIDYWFKELHLRQTHVVEGAGMTPNKVSRAARGLDVHMQTLRDFAEFFEVPFESVLVSPLRRLTPAEHRLVVDKLAADATRVMDQSRPVAPVRQRLDPRLLGIAKRIGKLPAELQKSVIEVIADYEKVAKKPKGRTGGGGGKSLKKA